MVKQQHTKIIVTHIRGKIIANIAVNPLVGLCINNIGLQHFDGRKCLPAAIDINVHRDNFKLHAVAFTGRIIPACQGVKRLSIIARALRKFALRYSPRARLAKLVVIRVLSDGR